MNLPRDARGNELNLGDTVAYAVRDSYKAILRIGRIVKIRVADGVKPSIQVEFTTRDWRHAGDLRPVRRTPTNLAKVVKLS